MSFRGKQLINWPLTPPIPAPPSLPPSLPPQAGGEAEVEKVRREAHAKVDELHDKATHMHAPGKAEL